MNLLYSNDKPGQYPDSWYHASAIGLTDHPRLKGAQSADVCIIGAGFTGLSAALHLAERGYDVAVLEAHRVGWGASGRNGGQVGSGQRREQDELEKTLGVDTAHKLWDIAEEAKATVASLTKTHAIPCDHRPGVAHVELHAKNVPHTHAYAEMLHRDYNYDQIELLDRAATCEIVGSTAYHGGTLDWGAAHIHPLNFALGLAKAAIAAGAKIYENSEVHHITPGDPVVVQTPLGKITAPHLILACNGYLGGLNRKIARKVMPINNFVVATEPLGEDGAKALISKDVAIADDKFVVNYFRRSADHRLLFGGAESYGYQFPADIRALVSKPMLAIYPQLKGVKLDYAWGGTLAITMNRLPCFSRPGPNMLSASGYSGHGVAMATMAGKILSAAIAGQAEQFDALANIPTPRFPGGPALRSPLLALAMTWYSLRDRLGL